MASSPSTHPFPWKPKTSNSPFTFTVSSSQHLSLSRTNPKISRIITFSLYQNQIHPISRKPIHFRKPIGAASFAPKDEIFLGSDPLSGESEEKEIRLKLEEALLEKKKRPLWRRSLGGSDKVRSILLLNVLAFVYASNIPIVKEVEAIIDPSIFTVVRFTVAAIAFAPFVLRARGNVQVRAAGLELGFWASLGYLLQALGLLTSDAGRASFFSLFTVIVVPLIDGMLGATVPSYTWFGALMSILGVGLLESSGSPPCVGDIWTLLSAIFFGIHMLRTERISRNSSKESFLALLGYQVSVVAMFSTVWYLAGVWFSSDPGWDPGSWTWTLALDWIVKFPWIPALYTGIFSTGLCLWVEITAMRDVSATETAIIYGLEPLWGAGFAWFLLGERWGIIGWVGAALVLGGSLTVQIFGSLSPTRSTEGLSGPDNQFPVSDNRNALPVSPIGVSSRKEAQDALKKK